MKIDETEVAVLETSFLWCILNAYKVVVVVVFL